LFIFVKFLESDQSFFINIEEFVNKDELFCWCNDIILVSTLIKNYCSTQRNLTKMTMHQSLKIGTKLKLKKKTRNQLDFLNEKMNKKNNSTKILTP